MVRQGPPQGNRGLVGKKPFRLSPGVRVEKDFLGRRKGVHRRLGKVSEEAAGSAG